MEGKVKWFDDKRGYGFLAGEDGRDHFVHWKDIVDKYDVDGKRLFASLTENAKVRFETEQKDGKEKAVNVVEIEGKGTEKEGEKGAKTEGIGDEKVM